MAQKSRDSGTPQAAAGTASAASAPEPQNDPQLLDIARLLDPKAAVSPQSPPAAEADTEEGETGNDLSQHAEHDGDEAAEPAADDQTETDPAAQDDSEADPAADAESDAAEGEAEDQAKDGEDDEDSVQAPKGLTPAAQHAFNKAIAREKGKRRELQQAIAEREAEIERLQAENAGLASSQPAPDTAAEPALLAKAKTEDEVRKLQTDAAAMLVWADEQLQLLRYSPDEVAAEVKAHGAQLDDFTEEAMTKWLLRVKRNAREVEAAAPGKLKRFEQQAQFGAHERRMSAEAERLIPWLKQPKSPEMSAFNEVLAQMPELKRRPNWKALAAAHVEGLKVIRSRAEKAAQATRQLTAKPARKTAGEPAPVNPVAARRAAAFSKLMKGEGRVEDVARFLG